MNKAAHLSVSKEMLTSEAAQMIDSNNAHTVFLTMRASWSRHSQANTTLL
jgi:hypothetical protein